MMNDLIPRSSPLFSLRRKTRTVFVGNIGIGGNHPIRIQSMTTSDTKDTDSTVAEIVDLVNAGCEIVRLTVPTKADCVNLQNIRRVLGQKRIRCPLVADIHFTPSIALDVVDYVEKVRINPGNFVDKKLFKQREYTDNEYNEELERITEKFTPLVLKCQDRGIAMRLGTNHGSLSDRIMNRYGDTPLGMVESAVEFLKIAACNNYHDIILSMKASNTQVMVAAYRLLAQRLLAENMDYPFHLGVTEAGDAEDGRIKSSVGIGTLLQEGIGDTIRVSLTEDSIHEIPVAGVLAAPYNKKIYIDLANPQHDTTPPAHLKNIYTPATETYSRRESSRQDVAHLSWGDKEPVRVWTQITTEDQWHDPCLRATTEPRVEGIEVDDQFYEKILTIPLPKPQIPLAVVTDKLISLKEFTLPDKITVVLRSELDLEKLISIFHSSFPFEKHIELCFKTPEYPIAATSFLRHLDLIKESSLGGLAKLSYSLQSPNPAQDYRILVSVLASQGIKDPIHLRYNKQDWPLLTDASTHLGSLLLDGIGDSIQINGSETLKENLALCYGLLQACRVRISKTEFIACPSCGRTLFNLQKVTAQIKEKTSHLKGLKIAIMGCIVNGPGEMADADFGYVGTGLEKVSLYVGKECVMRNIPQEQALEQLIALIKTHDRWVEK